MKKFLVVQAEGNHIKLKLIHRQSFVRNTSFEKKEKK